MILSIPSRAALCCIGLLISGCMQSMPSAEMITKPTQEAFARLTSWQPWRSQPGPEPVVLRSEPIAPVETTPLPAPEASSAAEPPAPPRVTASSSRSTAAASRRAPVRVVPVGNALPVPAKVVCETSNKPGERVRMECHPVE